ncbi:conserved protein, unknown function [Plasmodium yoelii]|uniref:Uncharacterized protein n=2 Tax=Plasmodium yoelii TaxID=5861 RepID=A0AAF0AZT8_PLAYO|nr:conserved protein, unknown function [Plasmodium yoelii]WBY54688.1 hypothetical protein Py17XNL_000202803 [Plasmodium yoelii yoelii]CDU16054.1 conserved Plasmodium protein, unknown function [Plasmodium yoelii]VTZ71678.1 conserved protein, unknown function [Plasmodium yoelii]|eukprot:XP_022811334.1 conserved protein, unknown function [Plasmodium yoelii]
MGTNKLENLKNSINTFEIFMNQYIVKYKNSKVCYICKNKININDVQKMEDICPKMWKYFHGIINQPQCPLQSFGKVLKVKDLRFEELEKYKDILQRK